LTPSSNPGDYAQIAATTANLDGTLDIRYGAGIYADATTYQDLIDAVTRNGAFASVRDNSALWETTAVYDAGANVDVEARRIPFDQVAGVSFDQGRLGEALESAYPDGSADFQDVIGQLFTLPRLSDVRKAFDQLGGAQHADVAEMSLDAGQIFPKLVQLRLDDERGIDGKSETAGLSVKLGDLAGATDGPAADAPSELAQTSSAAKLGASAWLRGYGNHDNVSSDEATSFGYDSNTWGIAGGIDYQATPRLLIGGGLAYGFTDADFDPNPGDSAEINTFEAGIYGRAMTATALPAMVKSAISSAPTPSSFSRGRASPIPSSISGDLASTVPAVPTSSCAATIRIPSPPCSASASRWISMPARG